MRGGSNESYENLLKTVAYLEFVANPIVCLKPGHYEVVDPKILKILFSILGSNGIYEPMVISPGVWIMAYVINKLEKKNFLKVSRKAALEVIQSTLQKYYEKNSLIKHIIYILANSSIDVKIDYAVIVRIFSRVTLSLSPDIRLGLVVLNILQFLAIGLGVGAFSYASIGFFLGFDIVVLQQLVVKLLSASLAANLMIGTTKPFICGQILQALPSNSTHSEYLLPVPTTAPRDDSVAMKGKIILYVQNKDEPEKSLYINVPKQQDMLCEKREFAKPLEGKILEASDLIDQASIPTYIQEKCTKIPGTSIPVTQKMKTRSDVKQHDEKLVREETDRSLTLLELEGILEDGNWYGAEKQLTPFKVNDQPPTKPTKQVPRLRGSNQSRRKQTMTIRDLTKDTCFVQEDTQRVSKLAEKAEKISHQDNYDDDYLI